MLFPTPKTRVVELIEPTRYVAKLQEPAVAGDPTSDQQSEQLPSYNAYSIDGDVTAPLVYVNFGVPKDYETLDRLGVSVKGAIVIARYGKSWRGIKPKVAAEHGAVGCIIYSDPHEDGYFNGDVFPKGPMRNENGVQRGSVADMPLYPGDPLTPGVAAKGDVKRLAVKDAPTITKIPVLPISYGDAKPLLAELQGPVAPEEFRGGLPITYHVGPGPAKVHLKVESNWDIKPIRDIIAKIPGAQAPDQWIIRGNHHDAWVNGAEDPLSGQVALLEEARSLSELLKQGWKPKRTIIFCAWDGEEPGLLGSTEWCEDHADELAGPRRPLRQFRQQRPRFSRCRGLSFSGKIRERRGSRHHRSREKHPGRQPPEGPTSYLGQCRRDQRSPDASGPPHRARWVRGAITPPLSTTSGLPRSISDSAVKTTAASTTPRMTIFTGTPTFPTPTSSTAGRYRRRQERC